MVFFIVIYFNRTFCKQLGDPDQTPGSAASGLGLYYLPMSHKKDARLIWVKSLPPYDTFWTRCPA